METSPTAAALTGVSAGRVDEPAGNAVPALIRARIEALRRG
jgi:hypothetical protein